MSVQILVAAGRARAESIMLDACTITRETTAYTDPQTGQQSKNTTTIYTGRCRIQMQVPGSASPAQPGEAYLLMLQLTVQLPIAVTGVQPGDIVTVTACPMDPELVNRKFRVQGLGHASHKTSRRLSVQEVT